MMEDFLNPKFVFFSPAGDHPKPLSEHVDHAIIALDRRAPLCGDCNLEALAPLPEHGPSTLRIDLWVEDLDDVSCTYGFTVSSENGSVAYARGERTVVNVDPSSRRPSRWSDSFLASHSSLRKDLQAYA